MLTYEHVRDWVRGKYGPRCAEGRITDLGYAYSVDSQPDAALAGDTSAVTYGNGPDLVVKRTGAVWQFGSNPMLLPLYEARSEDELRRSMATLLPGTDPDRPHESVPLPQSAPQASPYPPYPQAGPPAYAPAAPTSPCPPYPPAGHATAYPPTGPYQQAPVMPEFVAADVHHAVLVDATGISFDQRDVVTDFTWQDVQAVHHTARGLCLLVGVTHRNGMFYECRVGARRQARLREWTAQLAQVLHFYRPGTGM